MPASPPSQKKKKPTNTPPWVHIPLRVLPGKRKQRRRSPVSPPKRCPARPGAREPGSLPGGPLAPGGQASIVHRAHLPHRCGARSGAGGVQGRAGSPRGRRCGQERPWARARLARCDPLCLLSAPVQRTSRRLLPAPTWGARAPPRADSPAAQPQSRTSVCNPGAAGLGCILGVVMVVVVGFRGGCSRRCPRPPPPQDACKSLQTAHARV